MLTERLLEISQLGAEWVLWLLIGLSVFSLSIVIERIIYFYLHRDEHSRWQSAFTEHLHSHSFKQARDSITSKGIIGNVLFSGLDYLLKGITNTESLQQSMFSVLEQEKVKYSRRLSILGTIGNNAPFIGLFGTVLGIIQAFRQLGLSSNVVNAANNQAIMGAIGEALVATGVGILVAIPAVAAYNWLKNLIANKVKITESLMRLIIAQAAIIEDSIKNDEQKADLKLKEVI